MATALMRSLPRGTFDPSTVIQVANAASSPSSNHVSDSSIEHSTPLKSNQVGSDNQPRFRSPKKRWVPQRDSLARRRYHGRPGSKRNKRFLNSLYLNDVDFWDKPIEDILASQDLIAWGPEYSSIFQQMLESEDASKTWSQFTFVTEEEQEELLLDVCGEEPTFPESRRAVSEDENYESAEQTFILIEKETRGLLKMSFNLRLIQCLEFKILSAFVENEDQQKLGDAFSFFDEDVKTGSYVYFNDWNEPYPTASSAHKSSQRRRRAKDEDVMKILMTSSRDRKVVHGLCKFYGLFSKSENRSGDRVTVISRLSSRSIVIPELLLSSYLQIRLAKAM